jgi:hypothetical protein
MSTVSEYRALAEECFKWAREASDAVVCEGYVKLGQLWLERAVRAELPSGGIANPPQSKTADE